jgi:formylglycine-generating enzyme required for sulfatase activity
MTNQHTGLGKTKASPDASAIHVSVDQRMLHRTLACLVVALLTLCGAAPRAQDVIQDCAACPPMVVVPAGTAVLGAEPWEQDRRATEASVRTVKITAPFAVARTEITRAQYRAFVQATGYVSKTTACNTWGFNRIIGFVEGATWQAPGFPQREDHPVVCVSWEDATAYAAWLAQTTGKPYRLLSSTEFEYAARGGTRGPWFWGTDNTQACQYANIGDAVYRRLYSYGPVFNCDDGWERTAPVASYKPNPFGLYDMIGNAWEWTDDCFHAELARIPTDGRAWREEDGGDCAFRTARGGAWASGTDWAKASSQSKDPTGYQSQLLGFRVALTLARR